MDSGTFLNNEPRVGRGHASIRQTIEILVASGHHVNADSSFIDQLRENLTPRFELKAA